MNRSLIFAGAFILAAWPALSLAAPSGSPAHARPAAPAARPAAPSTSGNTGDFGVHARYEGQMKPLTMPQHFALHTPANFSPLALSASRRYALLSTPAGLWYPTSFAPACATNDIAAASSQRPSDFTLGSLVDGKSDLFAPPNHGAALTGANAEPASGPKPLTFQISSYQTGCGSPAFTNF